MISKSVMSKLRQIERHQQVVKNILIDIENKYPKLQNETCEDGLTFSQSIDANGSLYTAEQSARLFEKLLTQ